MIKEKALTHHIRLTLSMTREAEGLKITADERRVKQILYNLLSNAAKFTPDCGAITVDARIDGPELVVSVTDTGIGINAEEQKKLFQAFYQVNGGIRDKTPGTGLGLSITRKILEKHGGRIWIESDGPNKGSRFTFTLPINYTGVADTALIAQVGVK